MKQEIPDIAEEIESLSKRIEQVGKMALKTEAGSKARQEALGQLERLMNDLVVRKAEAEAEAEVEMIYKVAGLTPPSATSPTT